MPPASRNHLVLSISVLIAFGSNSFGKDGPLTPSESLEQFQLFDGLRIELVASEPDVVDPVAIAFDEVGRMSVAENRGYPLDDAPPRGVIALMEDKDDDGRYETRTEFATDLTFPNGILPWKGGIIATCAPDIFFLRDNNGDGVADEKRVLLTGFSIASTTQLRVSHPILGLDGWIYLTAGLQGGEVHAPEKPELGKVKFTMSDSRFHPETLEFQTLSGNSQFGQCFDDYGNRFSCANRNPIWHHVLQPHHLKRSPYYSFTETLQIVGAAQGDTRVFPLSEDTTTAGFHARLMATPHAGSFTSACATYVFRGTQLGQAYDGGAFICEPAQNLVQFQRLIPNGATFDSERISDTEDFLATEDSWSRMVYATQGPDGCLYLVDFYRKTLDHPQYLPAEIRDEADFQSGRDRGRIYRVVMDTYFTDGNIQYPTPGKVTFDPKVRNPESSGHQAQFGWARDTSFRLRLNREDLPVAAMKQSFTNRTGWSYRNPFPYIKRQEKEAIANLWLLQDKGLLDHESMKNAADISPATAAQVARIAELRIAGEPELIALLEALPSNDPKVRFHAALALGVTDKAERLPILANYARSQGNDRWIDAAILLAVGKDVPTFVDLYLKHATDEGKHLGSGHSSHFLTSLGEATGRALKDTELAMALPLHLTTLESEGPGARDAYLVGVLDGLQRRRTSFQKLISSTGEKGRKLQELVAKDHDKAQTILTDVAADLDARLQALDLFRKLTSGDVTTLIAVLLNDREPMELRLHVIDALVDSGKEDVIKPLVGERWRTFGTEETGRIVNRMLSRTATTPLLLNAIKEGVVQPWRIDSNRRGRLLKSKDKKISALANEVFKQLESGDRQAAYAKAKESLKLPVDLAKGREVYLRACASCHRLGELGSQVGPDLAGVRNQPAEALLLHIIIPNYEVYPGFAAYEVETSDDRVLSGLLTGENEGSIRLKMAQGIEETIPRSSIISMRSTSLSLMPQGLEQTMTEAELTSLIGFLKGGEL